MRWYVKIGLLVVVGLGGCKGCKEEKVPPIERPVSADFKFYDQVGPFGAIIGDPRYRLVETDTFYLAKAGIYDPFRVIYMATDTNCDSYTWKVGDDSRTFTGRASSLLFNMPGLYSVSLKVTRKTRNGSILLDSSSKKFLIIRTEYHPIIGKYIGYNVSKPDSLFRLYIGHGDQGTFPWVIDTMLQYSGYSGYVMTGLQGAKYSSSYVGISTKGGYRDEACTPFQGFEGNYCYREVFLIPSRRYDSIYVDYQKLRIPSPGSPEPPFINERFIGKRYL